MRLRVLGSSGAEFPNHNPPGFLLDETLLLDAGTIGSVLDEAEQWKIRHILLTHAHLDHIKSIPFLADNIVMKGRSHHVTVMGMPEVLKTLKNNLLNGRVWPDFTTIPNPGNPVLRLKSVKPGRPFELDGYRVVARRVSHAVPASGYVIEGKDGKRLLYTGDTGPTEDIWQETEKGIDCAIIEVSMPNRMRRMAVMTGHLTAGLLKEELKKMSGIPRKILVTHPKPQYLERIRQEIGNLGMSNIKLIKEGREYRI
jgi:ribonuclease BN (tRNA processing enzyme)